MNRAGELFINDMDAFKAWGVCLSDSSLCTLVEPEPLKDAVSNKSTTENGKQVRREQQPKVDERDITLFVQLYATSRDEMFSKLIAFKKELKKRRMNIRTKFEEGVVYRCDYKSCKQFKSSQWLIISYSPRPTCCLNARPTVPTPYLAPTTCQ